MFQRQDSDHRLTKGFSKATMLLTGSGPPVHKQLKSAIQECNEDKAIAIYMSKEGSKIHPSKPFPTKKVGGPLDTPLHAAAKYSLSKLFKMFLEYGGNPSMVNARQENCAHSVCAAVSFPNKRVEILEMILDWKANATDNTIETVSIAAPDNEGNTALHLAAFYGLIGCIEKLVERAAPLSILNSQDSSVCDMADRGNYIAIGTMLELAWIFQPMDPNIAMTQNFHKLTTANRIQATVRLLIDGNSLNLPQLVVFMENAIRLIAEQLDETAARAELLLQLFSWDVTALKKDYFLNSQKVLGQAKLQPRANQQQAALRRSRFTKTHSIQVGIPIEDVYVDPAYSSISSFVVYNNGVKKLFQFKEMDGKMGVYPADFDPTTRFLDTPTVSSNARENPKTTTVCQCCQQLMLEPVSLQQLLNSNIASANSSSDAVNNVNVSTNIVEPMRREVTCSSGHKYCLSCWSDHIQTLSKNDSTLGSLPCPHAQCGEILDLQWATILLPKQEAVQRLLAQRQKQAIDKLNLKWCPVPNCGLLVQVPREKKSGDHGDQCHYKGNNFSLHPQLSVPRVALCAHGHSFCLNCFHESHAPCACSDLTLWQELLRDATKQAASDKESGTIGAVLMSYPQSKACPSCHTLMNKEDGCNAITCSGCFQKYCFSCLCPWSLHGLKNGSASYCNRFSEQNIYDYLSALEKEDRIEQQTGDPAARRQKREKLVRIVHYYSRFMVHHESRRFEFAAKSAATERLLEGMHLAMEGETPWLQGSRAANPVEVSHHISADEENGLHSPSSPSTRSKKKPAELDAYFLKKDEAIDFIQLAFEELEKSRTLLQWSYPFALLEFDSRFTHVSVPASRNGKSAPVLATLRTKAEELRPEFELLQATLEYETESLSDVIARKRTRSTKQEISTLTLTMRNARLELEQLLLYFYSFQAGDLPPVVVVEVPAPPAPEVVEATSSSSAESASSNPKRHEKPEKDDKVQVPAKMQDYIRVVDDEYESDEDLLPKQQLSKSNSKSNSSSKPNIRPPLGSPSQDSAASGALKRRPTLSKITIDEIDAELGVDTPAVPEKARDSPRRAVPTNRPASLFKAGSQLNILLDQVKKIDSDSDGVGPAAQRKKKSRVPSLYVKSFPQEEDDYTLAAASNNNRSSHVHHDEAVRVKISPAVREEVHDHHLHAHVHPPAPELVVEQRIIGAKKDPDQEALEHAILISNQEEEFGINMYDALSPEDEPVIAECISQGFTREEAILIVFEHKVGKSSSNTITPAMPTLHKLPYVPPSQSPLVSEEDEPEIELLMTRGYTREQAIEVLIKNRNAAAASAAAATTQIRPQVTRMSSTQAYNSSSNNNNNSSSQYFDPPRNASSSSSVAAELSVESLMARGYTAEQARSIHRSAMQRPSESQPLSSRREYSPETTEDIEVIQLMDRGYTREQARQIAAASKSKPNNRSLSRTMSVTSNKDDEISRLLSQGYTREQAIQIAAHNSNNNSNNNNRNSGRGASRSSHDQYHGGDSLSVGSRSIYRASNMVNPADELDDMDYMQHQQPMYEQEQMQSFYDPAFYNNNTRPASMTGTHSQEQISHLLAQQEAEYGINMYDSVVPTDEPEIERMLSMGYSREDAVLAIFEQRYHAPSNNPNMYSDDVMYSGNVGFDNGMYVSGYVPQPQMVPVQSMYNAPYGQYYQQQQPPQQSQYFQQSPQVVNNTYASVEEVHTHHGNQNNRRTGNARSSSMYDYGTGNDAEDDALARALRLSEEEARQDRRTRGTSRRNSFRKTDSSANNRFKYKASDVKQLEKMGFTKDQAVQALLESNNDVQLAAEMLATSVYG